MSVAFIGCLRFEGDLNEKGLKRSVSIRALRAYGGFEGDLNEKGLKPGWSPEAMYARF